MTKSWQHSTSLSSVIISLMKVILLSEDEMVNFGKKLAKCLVWPFCIELIGDLGAGKTTIVRGLAHSLEFEGDVSSPSFTINNRYQLPLGKQLSHYDFYRLNEAGVTIQDLAEDLNDPNVSVVLEWASSVKDVLPANHVVIEIKHLEVGREILIKGMPVCDFF